MFDYKLLAALAAVVEQAGFERAALALGLSQSAVSQRIKLLEARVGQPVLLRGSPPKPTEVGRRLLNHVQQVRLLERDIQGQIPALMEAGSGPERLRIAINADSLATWWGPAIADFCSARNLVLDLVVEDQEVGLKRMRTGDVAACVCGAEKAVSGARSIALGAMRYRALASPAYLGRYFPDGVDTFTLSKSPAVVFGPDDSLQHRFLESLGFSGSFPYHLCPSSEGFVQLVANGLGWGLVPELQAQDALARGELVELLPYRPIDVPLYWHHWRTGGELLEALTGELLRTAGKLLIAGDG
ncbi:LysR family transcriptional regulator ArgP [Microbulbifer sp. HZ11]|uniref:LysR family transcriptional regulator ArgP n=1 Tax=unclassified Microbulbifer TaxID=2619833 RepID=UPI0005B87F00|nr:LysR family transcriptional regulator ArgP [Microbulbifer sp. HZ11]